MGFAFKAVPPTSFEDITLDFEQVGYTEWEGDVSGRFGDLKVNTVLGGQVPITTVSARMTGSDWIAASLENGWANMGGAFEAAGYLRDPFGFVHLKGTIKSGTIGSAAFLLPAGYRPGALAYYLAPGDGPAAAEVQITAAGGVNIYDQNTDVGLSGIMFLAEN